MSSNSNYTIEKTQVECYKIRLNPSCEWADITIDTGDKSGRIVIASGLGNWGYYFGACSNSFKEFLIGLSVDYIANKFGANHCFDLCSTIEQMRKDAKEYFDGDEMKQVLKQIQNLDGSSESAFVSHVWRSPDILKMYDMGPDIHHGLDLGFKIFWEQLWPIFINELKAEVSHV